MLCIIQGTQQLCNRAECRTRQTIIWVGFEGGGIITILYTSSPQQNAKHWLAWITRIMSDWPKAWVIGGGETTTETYYLREKHIEKQVCLLLHRMDYKCSGQLGACSVLPCPNAEGPNALRPQAWGPIGSQKHKNICFIKKYIQELLLYPNFFPNSVWNAFSIGEVIYGATPHLSIHSIHLNSFRYWSIRRMSPVIVLFLETPGLRLKPGVTENENQTAKWVRTTCC